MGTPLDLAGGHSLVLASKKKEGEKKKYLLCKIKLKAESGPQERQHLDLEVRGKK